MQQPVAYTPSSDGFAFGNAFGCFTAGLGRNAKLALAGGRACGSGLRAAKAKWDSKAKWD